MTSTIGTRSIQYQSIFSSSESHASANTEWTFEPSIKLGDDGNDVRNKEQEKRISPRGRPSNEWTSRSLRRLIRLYLLTDLDLDCIIDRLRTDDFQPCKRNVQEKLTLLLQPQPNRIRPKGDTKILRTLLRECRALHKTRRLRKQRLRSLPEWVFQDSGPQSQQLENANLGQDTATRSILDSWEVTDIHDRLDFDSQLPDLMPDSNFMPNSDCSFPEFGFVPSTDGSAVSSAARCTGILDDVVPQFNESTASSVWHTLAGRKLPRVNSTYVRDNEWLSDFDAPNLKEFEVPPIQLDVAYPASQVTNPSFQQSLPNQHCLPITENIDQSKHSASSSISTLMSKMSLSQASISYDAGNSRRSDNLSGLDPLEAASPIILPGILPEYCWEHINRNQLLRCNQWNESQNYSTQCYGRSTPTIRTLDTNILSRIIQRTVRKEDLHEIDAFGNSTLHISATMCATPSYLISLIKLGANINAVNNAGETFMHLLKPEVLNDCDDLCYLFELLRVQGFNFRQHDHLGQSLFHVMLRPWIDQDTLRKIITQMNELPIHRHISTARDCFGYTVVAQLNLHGTDLGINLDHAIFSLSCETDKSIFNSSGLQSRLADSSTKQRSLEQQSSRNYENHPYLVTVNDLFLYEQHVDYWRTILTAKDSPWFEDSNGRNGLHCLAAASLVTPEMPLPANLLGQLDSLRDMGEGSTTDDRASFTKSLLNLGVNPNNYDNDGNTPFMAFIIHHHDAEDDCTARILSSLVEAGSDIHRRNRDGETALHLAVRLGRRAATKFLLASGANIHARTKRSLGVLELGHKQSLACKQDENLFAQIMLCMSLVATCGAVSEPTIIDEWGTPGLRVVVNKTVESRGFKLVKKFIGIKLKRRR